MITQQPPDTWPITYWYRKGPGHYVVDNWIGPRLQISHPTFPADSEIHTVARYATVEPVYALIQVGSQSPQIILLTPETEGEDAGWAIITASAPSPTHLTIIVGEHTATIFAVEPDA